MASAKFDSDELSLGDVYAKALLGAAEKSGEADAVVDQLQSLVVDVLEKLPKLDAVLSSPRVPTDAKVAIIDKALAGRASERLVTFLKVVARHGRLNCLRAIAHAAENRRHGMLSRVPVEIRVAEPLTDAQRAALEARLREQLRADVILSIKVREELLGGMVIRVGDTVHDSSVRNQLERLRSTAMRHAHDRIREAAERFVLAE